MKTLKIITISILIFFLLLILTLGVIFCGLHFLMSDGKELSDQQMIEYFNKNQKQFNTLNAKIIELKEKGLKRIDNDWTDPKDISKVGLNIQDLAELRKEMDNLNIPRGVNCFDDSLEYYSYTSGLSVSGGMKGYYYSKNIPQNFYKNDPTLQLEPYENYQDKIIPKTGSYIIYTQITENWYIVDEYED